MDNQVNNTPSPKNNIFIYLLVVFFAIFIGTSIFLVVSQGQIKNTEVNQTQQKDQNTLKQDKMILPTKFPTTGSLKLVELSNTKNQLTINLNANSNNESITAYDVLLEYDPLSFDFIEAKSLIAGYQVYSFKKDNRISLTVANSNLNTAPAAFNDTNVISLEFKPKKPGTFDFSILAESGNEKTKFVNDKTEVLRPEINEIQVKIK